ncbi:MAG: acyl-ACP--UDP-N-acetylglucosamine O-acyltransferase [Succinivibrionaceae bacterium]|nr:acyl-ACP--UDP-N-acetylglucosamine O-acyltransferase [Succinivibrionaceae bacterium]
MIDSTAKIDSTARVHETAIIGRNVVVGAEVEIGPFTLVGDDVEIGAGTRLLSHAVLKGPTKVGCRNLIYQFASIGEDCQDKKYNGETTYLEIGDDNVFREHSSVHRGTAQDQSVTRIGSRNLFMINSHIAHDCVIGNDCIFANNATLAGHVHIGNYVIFGGLTAIHQHGRVGDHAFVAGCAGLNKDCPPFVMAAGHYAEPVGINSEGLKRRGFSSAQIESVRQAYKVLYRSHLSLEEARTQIAKMAETEPCLLVMVDFLNATERGIIR